MSHYIIDAARQSSRGDIRGHPSSRGAVGAGLPGPEGWAGLSTMM